MESAKSRYTATPVGPTTTFYFNGDCDDCAGALVLGWIPLAPVFDVFHATGDGQYQHVTGTLVLSNFTPGVALTSANFVSFSYDGSSIIQPFTVTTAVLSGTLNADGSLATNFRLAWSSPNVVLTVSSIFTFCGFGAEGSSCEFDVNTTVKRPVGVMSFSCTPNSCTGAAFAPTAPNTSSANSTVPRNTCFNAVTPRPNTDDRILPGPTAISCCDPRHQQTDPRSVAPPIAHVRRRPDGQHWTAYAQ